MKTELTPEQVALLKNNPDVKAIAVQFAKYDFTGHTPFLQESFDSFASQFDEPDWKILSLRAIKNTTAYNKNQIIDYEGKINPDTLIIRSVQYKEQVLTVGDYADFLGVKNKQIIKFEVDGPVMKVYYDEKYFNYIGLVKKILNLNTKL